MASNKDELKTGIGCTTMALLWLFFVILYSFWTDRSLDYWATVAHHGTPTDVPYWLALLTSFLPITFLANIITEIMRFIL